MEVPPVTNITNVMDVINAVSSNQEPVTLIFFFNLVNSPNITIFIQFIICFNQLKEIFDKISKKKQISFCNVLLNNFVCAWDVKMINEQIM